MTESRIWRRFPERRPALRLPLSAPASAHGGVGGGRHKGCVSLEPQPGIHVSDGAGGAAGAERQRTPAGFAMLPERDASDGCSLDEQRVSVGMEPVLDRGAPDSNDIDEERGPD